MRYVKRICSLLLALAMVVGLVPAAAFTAAATETYPQISLGQEITLSTDVDGGEGTFQFVPEEDGIYRFYSYNNASGNGTLDTRGYILDEDLNILKADDDGGNNNNFVAEYSMTAGRVYHLMAQPYSATDVGVYSVSIIKLVRATSMEIVWEEIDGFTGDRVGMYVEFFPHNAAPESFTATSADPEIASVDPYGQITLLSEGSTTITVTSENGLTDTVSVTVTDPTPIGLGESLTTMDKRFEFIAPKDGFYRVAISSEIYGYLTVRFRDSFGSTLGSAAGKECKVDVELKAEEKYIIDALVQDAGRPCTYTISITELQAATALEIVGGDISGYPGDSCRLAVQFLPDNGAQEAVTWTSENPKIAEVDANGSLQLLSEGATTITATSQNGLTDSITVTVKGAVDIALDQQVTLTTDVDGGVGLFKFVPEKDDLYRFYSFNSDIDTYGYLLDAQMQEITHDDDDGEGSNFSVEYALTAGQTYYYKAKPYSSNSTGTYNVIVIALVPATAVEITVDAASGYTGDSFGLDVAFSPANGMVETVTWTSADPEIAEVNADGYLKLLSEGTTTITVTSQNGLTDSIAVTVKGVASITLGQTVTLTTDVDNGVGMFRFVPEEDGVYRFYSFDSSLDTYGHLLNADRNEIANDDDDGEGNNFLIEYPMVAGETYYLRVRPLSSGHVGRFSVMLIKLVPATAVQIDKEAVTGYPGEEQKLVAKLYPDNAIMETITWTSDDPNVATVDAEGRVQLVAVGTTTVTARTESGLTASVPVTVKEYPVLEPGVAGQVTLTEPGQLAWFTFTPQKDGYYAFYSVSNVDTYGAILDAEGNELASNDDAGNDLDFKVKYQMEAGKTYILQAKCYGSHIGTFEVFVEETEYITKLEVVGLPQKTEYVEGYLDNIFLKGLRLQATWSDGTVTNWLSIQDELYIDYMEDERIELDTSEVETSHKVNISCGGQITSFPITVIENPVDHLELVHGTDYTYYVGGDSYAHNGYPVYYAHYPLEAKVRIVYKDGTSVVAHVGEWVDDYLVNWEHYQEETPWVVGTDNPSSITYLGHTVNVPITLKENTVESIEMVSGSLTLVENSDGRFEEGGYFYYYYELSEDTKVKINYTDGTTKTVAITDKVDGHRFDWRDDQYNNPWTVGGDNYITVSYLGVKGKLPVNVIVSPVESIVMNSAPTREYIYGDFQYGYRYTEGYEFHPRDLTGLSFTVNYKDGTSQTFTHADMDEDGYINGYRYELNYLEWAEKAGEYTVTFGYMGKSFDYKVKLKESNVSSVAVTKMPANCVYDGFFTPTFIGMEILITYTDNTTRKVTVTEQNSEYAYHVMYGAMCEVTVGEHKMVILSDYRSFAVGYLGQFCEIPGLQPEYYTRWVSKVSVEKVTKTGEGMIVHITYSDGVQQTLTVRDPVHSYFDEEVVNAYGKTENGLLRYTVETQYDEDGKPELYRVHVLNEEFVVEAPKYMVGDMNNDGTVTDADAMYLLRHTLFASRYPIDQDGDFNDDGTVTDADAMYLLRHTLFPGRYPL